MKTPDWSAHTAVVICAGPSLSDAQLDAARDSCRFQGALAVNDSVNHPKHYTSHPSGVECITITEHMGFNLGNALKYIWRADLKNDTIEDLKKAAWYVQREIALRERAAKATLSE